MGKQIQKQIKLVMNGVVIFGGVVYCYYRVDDEKQLPNHQKTGWEIDVDSMFKPQKKGQKPELYHCVEGKDGHWYIHLSENADNLLKVESHCKFWLSHMALYIQYKIDIEYFLSLRAWLNSGKPVELWKQQNQITKKDFNLLCDFAKESLSHQSPFKFIEEKTGLKMIVE